MLVLPKLISRQCKNWGEFINFWSDFYEPSTKYPDEKYLEHLKWRGGHLLSVDVRFLFDWKTNGRRLPAWDFRPIVRKLPKLNALRFTSDSRIERIASRLSKHGPVKKYFICHITSPLVFPIWDKNVLAAYLIVTNRENRLKNLDDLIGEEQVYHDYRKVFNRAMKKVRSKSGFPPFRRLDQALFALGSYRDFIMS